MEPPQLVGSLAADSELLDGDLPSGHYQLIDPVLLLLRLEVRKVQVVIVFLVLPAHRSLEEAALEHQL